MLFTSLLRSISETRLQKEVVRVIGKDGKALVDDGNEMDETEICDPRCFLTLAGALIDMRGHGFGWFEAHVVCGWDSQLQSSTELGDGRSWSSCKKA